ncbi:hypothetical protein RND71_025120 [Anisodus tanguticus]|uniref:Uncharacterized protein n=1 Tax=Anisodus tanguticus TaxID=243964 RepID=A0AAE1RRW7_9SOLA|nr:hypothetical protein RND71_025120 [Anisodus tanguticus]
MTEILKGMLYKGSKISALCRTMESHKEDCSKHAEIQGHTETYVDMSNKVEDAENLARFRDFAKQMLEMSTIIRERSAEQRKAIEKIHAKLAELKSQTKNCNDLQIIRDAKFLPVIVFSFSRRGYGLYAQFVQKDFNTELEKQSVKTLFNNAVNLLSKEDGTLKSVKFMSPLLQCCIGVHHSDLLPVMKDLVEILFQNGLIKTLFATETMSGRTGRRGEDEIGINIIMIDKWVSW